MTTVRTTFIFCSKHEGPAKLFDESEERARLQERQKLFKDYHTKRQTVMQVRNADREQRNLAKVKQLEQAEQWQVYYSFEYRVTFRVDFMDWNKIINF